MVQGHLPAQVRAMAMLALQGGNHLTCTVNDKVQVH